MEKGTISTLEIITIARENITEYFIHGQKDHQKSETEILDELFDYLSRNNAQPVAFRIFTSEMIREKLLKSYADAFSKLKIPVTWISQNDLPQSKAFSVQVQAFSGTPVETVKLQDTIVGCRYADDDAEYFQLSFLPDDLSAGNSQQASAAFEKCRQIMIDSGLDFENVARTWLFTHDILSWYDKLNLARDDFFNLHDIFNKTVPASTGVGVANPAGVKLTFEAFAVNPKNGNVQAQKVDSPLQCAALDYRSSFSRAVHIQTNNFRRVLVSGTASIDPDGNTIFLDDTARQIDKTMEVAKALLNNADMDWKDVVRGIMYFKNADEFNLFDDWCQKNNVTLPHIKVHADICRDDLLFELEVDAITL